MDSSQRRKRQEVSCILCSILDNVGFSEDIRKLRIELYGQLSNAISNKLRLVNFHFLATGSKAEGAGLFLSSDFDFMAVGEDVICLSSREIQPHFTTLKAAESPDVPPGYLTVTATNIVKHCSIEMYLKQSLLYQDINGYPYVSSTKLRNISSQTIPYMPIQTFSFMTRIFERKNGPAMTVTTKNIFTESNIDMVKAIYYFESKYLSNWSSRNEFKCWPCADMIKEISTTEGYIVPVGSLEGCLTNLEWRVSYVTAENKLVHSFNQSQFKLYVMLKMIAKELIKPDFPFASSYVIKNVVLWVCELSPWSFFRQELLIEQIAKCLKFLKVCVCNNHLPNYFIPERNLLSSRLEACSKQSLIERLNFLIDRGDSVYCRLQIFIKHSFLLISETSMKEAYGKRRDEIERCHLLMKVLCVNKVNSFDLSRSSLLEIGRLAATDDTFWSVYMKKFLLIMPDFIDLFLLGGFQLAFQMFEMRFSFFLE